MRVLAILLFNLISQVYLTPYQVDSSGLCKNPNEEYPHGNLCCRKCSPGKRLNRHCTADNNTDCVECSRGEYMERWNYRGTCRSCAKCIEGKGLQYAQHCTNITKSTCKCQPGMFCIMGFDTPSCKECAPYTLCKLGYGVSQRGTFNSDVECAPCPPGMFSDKVSYTDPCHSHTECKGRAVLNMGTSTSDTVCEPVASSHLTTTTPTHSRHAPVSTDSTLQRATVSLSPVSVLSAPTTDSFTPSLNHSTADPTTKQSVEITIAIVVGLIVMAVIGLVILKKVIQRKGSHPKPDANGNCEAVKISNDLPEGEELVSLNFTQKQTIPLRRVSNPAVPMVIKSSPSEAIGLLTNNGSMNSHATNPTSNDSAQQLSVHQSPAHQLSFNIHIASCREN